MEHDGAALGYDLITKITDSLFGQSYNIHDTANEEKENTD